MKSIKFNKSMNYQRYLPTEFIIEILQELKIKGSLSKINGIYSHYLSTQRMIDTSTTIRIFNHTTEREISTDLKDLGNSDIEILVERQLLANMNVWAQLYRSTNPDNSFVYIMDTNIAARDILSNGTNSSSSLNRLGPKLIKNID